MPVEEKERLQKQTRERMTYPLRNVEHNRCSVYNDRPTICRLQGTQEGLPCPHNPSAQLGKDGQGILGKDRESFVVLGLTIKSQELLK